MTGAIRILPSLHDISARSWNACAAAHEGHLNPFVSHEFLLALEDSGSATRKTGWAPHHLVLDVDGTFAGVAPCYLKSHSHGEYVFDHGWADAFHRAGGRYYPKLQTSVPFTPVTGPRLLAADPAHRAMLAQGLQQACQEAGASSAHVTFVTPTQAQSFQQPGWLHREDIQFHWHNAGYDNFAGFLGALSSSKRKTIRKERESFVKTGITFEWHSGPTLTEADWDHFFAFYMDTGSRKWGSPYLTREFFAQIHETMSDQILLVLAYRAGRCIAGALNFIGADTLYGRNWGCIEHHPFLHFEVCYYQAIDFAISRGLKLVEAGAQGEHKLARGYLPVKTSSFHYLRHQGLAIAVANYLIHERDAVSENQDMLSEHSPFRHVGDTHDI